METTSIKKYLKQYTLYLVLLFLVLACLNLFEYISLSTAFVLFFSGIASFYMNVKPHQKVTSQDVIVLTGCDSGLGYSLALYCHNNLKLRVIAGVHNSESSGAQRLAEYGIHILHLEITDPTNVNAFTDSIQHYLKEKKCCLRALVNNAGMMVFGEFEWQTEEQIQRQVEVNLLGTMRLTHSMLPILREHKSRLIIVTSHCASEALPGVATYGATKAALTAWATSLRIELAKSSINVVCFIPGSFVGESNLLSRQKLHFTSMESAMKEEAKCFYKNYFELYASYLSSLSRNNSLIIIKEPTLYEAFEDALLEEDPRTVYKCEPWRYMMYHFLFKVTPTKIRDSLVNRFMQMPAWEMKRNE